MEIKESKKQGLEMGITVSQDQVQKKKKKKKPVCRVMYILGYPQSPVDYLTFNARSKFTSQSTDKEIPRKEDKKGKEKGG